MAKPLMIQGTMSNAGKSLLTAGLCRIIAQDGYRVAPFKAQNIALNSYITEEGLEIGRAQAVQAEAAKISPDVRMNPVLIKFTDMRTSQIVLNGKSIGNVLSSQYSEFKTNLVPHITSAYESLSREVDIIIIEGAGSPAEINLNKDDIVNMGMAKRAKAPVLIAGDIDRGGVFASLYGTIMLLEEAERKYIKGTIINKFRGDCNSLKPGLGMLEELTHVPVIGVVPYLEIDIDEEDGVTERFFRSREKGIIDIAVILLPRISNFTDFASLEHIGGASVRYIRSPIEFGNPDLLIIPGTKNTIGDLLWMRGNGLETAVLQYAKGNKPVFGICGGYQMLSEKLSDPHGVEHGGEVKGMGLLDSVTVFEREKTRTRVTGTFNKVEGIFKGLKGKSFEGYEIHMGQTDLKAEPFTVLTENSGAKKTDGLNRGNIYGCHVHGIFDSEEVLFEIADALMKDKGLNYSSANSFNLKDYKEKQYDLLAEALRKSLDMKAIYKIIEEGV